LRIVDLFLDFVFTNIHRFSICKNYVDYAHHIADMQCAWFILDRYYLYILYCGWIYGYDFTDKSRLIDWVIDLKRFLWKMG